MTQRGILAALLLGWTVSALAQQSSPPSTQPSNELQFLQNAIVVLQEQRNKALDAQADAQAKLMQAMAAVKDLQAKVEALGAELSKLKEEKK